MHGLTEDVHYEKRLLYPFFFQRGGSALIGGGSFVQAQKFYMRLGCQRDIPIISISCVRTAGFSTMFGLERLAWLSNVEEIGLIPSMHIMPHNYLRL